MNNQTELYGAFSRRLMERFYSEDNKENLVFSPLSVLLLLGMAAQASDGKTRSEIISAVAPGKRYEELTDMLKAMQNDLKKSRILDIANAVIIKNSIKDTVKPDYEGMLSEIFDGELIADPDIVGSTNHWVNRKTRGMIPVIVDDSIKEALACLINAAVFEDRWKFPYEAYDIEEGVFTNADKTKTDVTVLSSSEDYYIDSDKFTGTIKPYRCGEYSLMLLLPRKAGVRYMKEAVADIDFSLLYDSAVRRDVVLHMPEFKFDFGSDITEICKAFGIKDAFENSADFSNLCSEELKIDSVIHKAHIEVDRKGTRAAAATAAICVGAGIPDFEFIDLNRPFVFAVMHNESRLPVFVGITSHI